MRYLLLGVLVFGCRKATPDVRPENRTATEERVKCTVPEADPITTTVQ